MNSHPFCSISELFWNNSSEVFSILDTEAKIQQECIQSGLKEMYYKHFICRYMVAFITLQSSE